MNNSELVDIVATKCELSKKDAAAAVSTIFDEMTAVLGKGGEVRLSSFGFFSVAKRAARAGRNPSTGEAIKIPSSKNVKFKAAASLKARVNKK